MKCPLCSVGDLSVREKRDSSNRFLYAYQCNECLCRHGDWIPHSDPRTRDALPWAKKAKRQQGLFE